MASLGLSEAWLELGDPALAEQFRELERQGYNEVLDGIPPGRDPAKYSRCSNLKEQMRSALVERLKGHKLVATGVFSSDPARGRRPIPADLWELGTSNWRLNWLATRDWKITGVCIEVPTQKSDAPPGHVSEAHLREWYVKRLADLQANGKRSSRDDDIAAAKSHFSKPVTGEAVRKLRSALAPVEWRTPGAWPKQTKI